MTTRYEIEVVSSFLRGRVYSLLSMYSKTSDTFDWIVEGLRRDVRLGMLNSCWDDLWEGFIRLRVNYLNFILYIIEIGKGR